MRLQKFYCPFTSGSNLTQFQQNIIFRMAFTTNGRMDSRWRLLLPTWFYFTKFGVYSSKRLTGGMVSCCSRILSVRLSSFLFGIFLTPSSNQIDRSDYLLFCPSSCNLQYTVAGSDLITWTRIWAPVEKTIRSDLTRP